ncbi:MAG: ATP-dependent Clp protease ATP-binding subunit [Candidatus Berkelbacteria bacterium]
MENIFGKFGDDLKKTLVLAEKYARDKNVVLDTQHQLWALATTKDTLAYEILQNNKVTEDRVSMIVALLGEKSNLGQTVNISDEAKKTLQIAVQTSLKNDHDLINTEHLLLALLSSKTFNSYLVIERIGIDPKVIQKQIETIFKSSIETGNQENQTNRKDIPEMFEESELPIPFDTSMGQMMPANPKKENALEQFTTDLTKQAEDNKLDPVIGRQKEISRIIQTLSRRTKNNPVLIGDPGVGKTAIIEGLAARIASGDVPQTIDGFEILSLDLGSVIAGTMYRGQFESRVKNILAEIKKKKKIILFIDEIHMMVGAGSTEGSVDAANLLKPMLARGEIRVIGATTFDEYKKHIEKDAALERRFQPIIIDEPSTEETVTILEGIKPKYEKHHGVIYSKESLVGAVELSQKYISDRFLPDKAIDLIDEAGAKLSILRDKGTNRVSILKKELQKLLKNKESLIKNEKFEAAVNLRSDEIKIVNKIKILKAKAAAGSKPRVELEDIAALVSDWTGIPVTSLSVTEKRKINNIEKEIKKSIIGQDKAIKTVADFIKKSHTGISSPDRPIGSFIFLGPTGVGKTETAKVLAKTIFGSEDALIRIDMSEFMEKHNVSRLIGAPAGYIGYEEGGKLTEAIRKRPYSIILLDEIEKAHPDVFNILLQIMDDGHLSDAKGRKVNFRNTILIMTSNLGSDITKYNPSIGFEQKEDKDNKNHQVEERLINAVKDEFKPEFLNRLDKIVVFYPLDKESAKKIADIQIEKLLTRLLKNDVKLSIPESVKDFIVKESYSPDEGARAIQKYISENVESVIANLILKTKEQKKLNLSLRVLNNKIVSAK